MSHALETLIGHWKADPLSTYNTWFLWEERLKNFRSIRRGLAQVVKDGEAAEAAALQLGVEEAVDHRQAVMQQVGQADADQTAGAVVLAGQAVFDQMGADGRVLDHRHIVQPAHVGHAAAGMAGAQIAAQKVELLHRRLGLDQIARQIGVARQDAAARAREFEIRHRNPHRDAGDAGLASRAIGDVLAAAEPGLGQGVVDVGAVAERQVGEDLALELTRQIGAGRAGGHEEAELAREEVLGHGCRSVTASAPAQGPDE